MVLHPLCSLLHALALILHAQCVIHQQSLSQRSAQRVDDDDLSVRKFLLERLRRQARGVCCTAQARRKGDVQDIAAGFQNLAEQFFGVLHAGLLGLGLSALPHFLIKSFEFLTFGAAVDAVLSINAVI